MPKIKISELFTDKQKNWLLGLLALTTVFSLLLNITSPLSPQSSEAGWFGLGGWLRSGSLSRSIWGTNRQTVPLQDYRRPVEPFPHYADQTGPTSPSLATSKVLDLGFSYTIPDPYASSGVPSSTWMVDASLSQYKDNSGGLLSKSTYFTHSRGNVGGYITFPQVFVSPSSTGNQFVVNINLSRHVSLEGYKEARCTGTKSVWVPADFAGNSISENIGDLSCILRPITTGLNPVPETENILTEIKNRGSSLVIIKLRGNEYTSSDYSNTTKKMEEIRRLQDDFLQNYSSEEISNIKRLDYSPFLGAKINESAYYKIINDPRVESMQLDKPVPMAQ